LPFPALDFLPTAPCLRIGRSLFAYASARYASMFARPERPRPSHRSRDALDRKAVADPGTMSRPVPTMEPMTSQESKT
jgi:hypothetical protein